jgi:hypothetical protein
MAEPAPHASKNLVTKAERKKVHRRAKRLDGPSFAIPWAAGQDLLQTMAYRATMTMIKRDFIRMADTAPFATEETPGAYAARRLARTMALANDDKGDRLAELNGLYAQLARQRALRLCQAVQGWSYRARGPWTLRCIDMQRAQTLFLVNSHSPAHDRASLYARPAVLGAWATALRDNWNPPVPGGARACSLATWSPALILDAMEHVLLRHQPQILLHATGLEPSVSAHQGDQSMDIDATAPEQSTEELVASRDLPWRRLQDVVQQAIETSESEADIRLYLVKPQ